MVRNMCLVNLQCFVFILFYLDLHTQKTYIADYMGFILIVQLIIFCLVGDTSTFCRSIFYDSVF